MKRPTPLLVTLLLTAATLATTACNTAGPHAVRTARAPYNEALVRTWNEQLLLNLVRLRYRDTPFFLEVDSLTTQYDFGASASAATDLGPDSDDIYSLGTGGSVSESPTVVYKPLQGEKFVTQLLQPISLDKVMLLSQSGWSIERVFRVTVQEIADIANAPSTTGPTPDYPPDHEEFNCLARLLRDLQKDKRLTIRAEELPQKTEADDAQRFRYSLRLREADDPARDATVRRGVCDCFDIPAGRCEGDLDDPRARQVLQALTPDRERDLLAGARVATRSLMGALYYLSQGVDVPAEDAALVTPIEGWGTMYEGFFRIHAGPTCRSERVFVRVPYRGRHFCIVDTDLQTKTTFGLLAQLVSLQAGSEAGALAPQLNIGLN